MNNALNMLVFHHKRRNLTKIGILIILIGLWSFTTNNGSAADPTGWGDIVDVNYSLWRDAAHTIEEPGNIDVDLNYIYLSRGSTVPQGLQTAFPEASAAYITKFKEAIIGMAVGDQKDFKIDSADAYNDGDLYYRLFLLRIHYDASSYREELSGFDMFLIFGGGSVVVVAGVLLWRNSTSKRRKQGETQRPREESRH
ncbi:MAG: hypothetical protein ACW99F_09105 [Candidatus Hodarchaeales archaeon]